MPSGLSKELMSQEFTYYQITPPNHDNLTSGLNAHERKESGSGSKLAMTAGNFPQNILALPVGSIIELNQNGYHEPCKIFGWDPDRSRDFEISLRHTVASFSKIMYILAQKGWVMLSVDKDGIFYWQKPL